MPYRDTLIVDVATCAIANAGDYIDKSAIEAPSNYVKPEAIAGYIEKEYTRRVEAASLDLDLARISCIGWQMHGAEPVIMACRTQEDEETALIHLGILIDAHPVIITYNGHSFDLPLLMRRARYLGISFPGINIDRYKSYNLDLLAILSDRDPSRRRSLGFYVRRLGWTDLVKPLTGAQEACAPAEGRWAELEESVRHDVTATGRLAQWLGLLEPVAEPVL